MNSNDRVTQHPIATDLADLKRMMADPAYYRARCRPRRRADVDGTLAAQTDTDSQGRQLVPVPTGAPVAICARCHARWVSIDGQRQSAGAMFDAHTCETIQ